MLSVLLKLRLQGLRSTIEGFIRFLPGIPPNLPGVQPSFSFVQQTVLRLPCSSHVLRHHTAFGPAPCHFSPHFCSRPAQSQELFPRLFVVETDDQAPSSSGVYSLNYNFPLFLVCTIPQVTPALFPRTEGPPQHFLSEGRASSYTGKPKMSLVVRIPGPISVEGRIRRV